MSFWKKIGNVLKTVAPAALSFIPGIGGMVGNAVSGLFASKPDPDPMGPPISAMSPPEVANNGALPRAVVSAPSSFNWGNLISSAAPAIGSLAAGGLSYAGAQQANEANAQQAAMNRDFQAQQAQLSRDFQAQQSQASMDFSSGQATRQMQFQADQAATAYQRGTADMKAAGINPMLAYSQGGAHAAAGASGAGSAGSGASAGGAQATMANALGIGANSAMSGARDLADILNAIKIGEKIDAETANTNARTITELIMPEVHEQGIRTSASTAAQAKATTDNIIAGLPGVHADSAVKVKTGDTRVDMSKAELQNQLFQNVIASQGATQARNLDEFMKRHPDWFENFAPGLRSLSETLGVASSAKDFVRR